MATEHAPLRRPISPQQPMWIIHIDTWNTADPERIIEMVPKDILPYVCFVLSLSATDATCCSGPNVCDAWMKACASKRVWTMIQPSSGAHNRFSDTDYSDYERYFKEYPNFLGWNFAEQFWDFGAAKSDGTGNWPTFMQRLNTFVQIYKYCQRYGGYFCTSFTQAFYSASMMPIAYMKRNAEWRELMKEDPEHFICCEKYTMSSCFLDIESNVVGALIGKYAGQIGIRYDDCGWQNNDPDTNPYIHSAGAVPVIEHMMLDGETVLDGPELIPNEASHEVATSAVGSYTRRNWAWYPQYQNIYMDFWRKILDGTIRIPTRQEVIDRTKIVVKNDLSVSNINDDNIKDPYISIDNQFDYLYRWDEDRGGQAWENHWLDNRWWFKKTGRYPCFPQVYDLLDDYAKEKLTVINRSAFNNYFPSKTAKVNKINALFPEEYTGSIYASHIENTWMTYNPFQYNEEMTELGNTEVNRGNGKRIFSHATNRAKGNIPLQYNTSKSLSLNYAPYSLGVVKEYTDSIHIYLQNYSKADSQHNMAENPQTTDTIMLDGIDGTPTISWHDRASHKASTVTHTFVDGVLTIAVKHNGPLDINITCRGKETNRKTEYTKAVLIEPERPPLYIDTLEYQAEFMDYKSISANRTNGYYFGNPGYRGQGFVEFGQSSSATLRDTVWIPFAGTYKAKIRYKSPGGSPTMGMRMNGVSEYVTLQKTDNWMWSKEGEFTLKEGANVFTLTTRSTNISPLIDCLQVYMTDETKDKATIAESIKQHDIDIVSVEYYDMTGRKVTRDCAKGILIRRTLLSNGSTIVDKIKK